MKRPKNVKKSIWRSATKRERRFIVEHERMHQLILKQWLAHKAPTQPFIDIPVPKLDLSNFSIPMPLTSPGIGKSAVMLNELATPRAWDWKDINE